MSAKLPEFTDDQYPSDLELRYTRDYTLRKFNLLIKRHVTIDFCKLSTDTVI